MPSWLVGSRDYETAKAFIQDLAARVVFRIRLTTDGLKVYIDAGFRPRSRRGGGELGFVMWWIKIRASPGGVAGRGLPRR